MTLLTATNDTTVQNQNEKPNDEKKNQRIPLAKAIKNMPSTATNAIEPLSAFEAPVWNNQIKWGYVLVFWFSPEPYCLRKRSAKATRWGTYFVSLGELTC